MTGHLRLSPVRRVVCKLRARLTGDPLVLPAVDVTPEEARAHARPTTTGLGDMLLSWMMPMTVARLMQWHLRVPVPRLAGGVRYEPTRPRLTAAVLSANFNWPRNVELVDTDEIPSAENWFHTAEAECFLNACRETSFQTIPKWIRKQLNHADYLAAYDDVASELGRCPASTQGVTDPSLPYLAVHMRRKDKGDVADEPELVRMIRTTARHFNHALVVSDDLLVREQTSRLLEAQGLTVLPQPVDPTSLDVSQRLFRDFHCLVRAKLIISSVAQGWSAFPYAAARMGQVPLLFTLEKSPVWRVLRAYSSRNISSVHLGPAGAEEACRSLPVRTRIA
jgi:hypothetical protein